MDEVKDCRTCRYGHLNDHWNLPFCYNDKECKDWELWEPKEDEQRALAQKVSAPL